MHKPDAENLRAAWEELRPELFRLARALGIGPTQADDVLQEVYVTAREKAPDASCAEDFRRWMIRVTVNRCRLEHRRTGRWYRAFERLTHWFERDRLDGLSSEPLRSIGRDEARSFVRKSLEMLPAETRTLLVLRYFAELNSTEIGKIFNLPEATVRSRLSAARQKLAHELRRLGYRHDE